MAELILAAVSLLERDSPTPGPDYSLAAIPMTEGNTEKGLCSDLPENAAHIGAGTEAHLRRAQRNKKAPRP
ncbi:MAG: hypothetical protein AB7I48_04740 [Planctomycetaceae bacterium]